MKKFNLVIIGLVILVSALGATSLAVADGGGSYASGGYSLPVQIHSAGSWDVGVTFTVPQGVVINQFYIQIWGDPDGANFLQSLQLMVDGFLSGDPKDPGEGGTWFENITLEEGDEVVIFFQSHSWGNPGTLMGLSIPSWGVAGTTGENNLSFDGDIILVRGQLFELTSEE